MDYLLTAGTATWSLMTDVQIGRLPGTIKTAFYRQAELIWIWLNHLAAVLVAMRI